MAMSTLGWLLPGVVLAGLLIGFARRLPWRAQIRLFAACLVATAAAYLVFGALQGPRWAGVEGIGFVLYSALAYAGLRRPPLLALGWLLHVGWDAGLHLAFDQPVIGPWLPLACLPFDCMVAAYLSYADSRQRAV